MFVAPENIVCQVDDGKDEGEEIEEVVAIDIVVVVASDLST